jgi:hypothetical protein
LIHHNVPDQPIHALLRDLDAAWLANAPLSTFGARQRWIAACRGLPQHWSADVGRARYGELTVPWATVSPT